MKIIVGLGNPGRKYARTRHNIGFAVAEEVARLFKIEIKKEKHHSLIGAGRIASEEVVLAKPQTFMNESGRAAAAILRDAYASPADLVVIHDELDLPVGTVRIKVGGGHGGHNGLRSVIEHLGSAEFIRVRVGIGRPAPGMDPADYVLSPFLPEERQATNEAVERAAEAVKVIATEGAARAMNLFNQRRT